MTAPLTREEEATLAKMKAEVARHARAPVGHGPQLPERFMGPVGIDDDGKPFRTPQRPR